MRHVFIIGAKSLGAYGGFETFVRKLAETQSPQSSIRYHIACKENGDGSASEAHLRGARTLSETEFTYCGARCFKVRVPNIGAAQAIYYDIAALRQCCAYIQSHGIKAPIVYILACRIGPAAAHFAKKIHAFGGKIYINPDGHEYKRAKWNALIRKYWKFSERLMVKHCDLAVCDSMTIRQYIRAEYAAYHPDTAYIAYGAETGKSPVDDRDETLLSWYERHGLAPFGYYLAVGRLVPENNYETMIREFLKTRTKRKLVLITNNTGRYLETLRQKTGFDKDERICFAGPLYAQDYLKKIRENAFASLHGHEVGGTNPSLLEALSATDVNLLLDVGFNREVAKDAALYWEKADGSLAALIDTVEAMGKEEREAFGQKAKGRIAQAYRWEQISDAYEKLFTNA